MFAALCQNAIVSSYSAMYLRKTGERMGEGVKRRRGDGNEV